MKKTQHICLLGGHLSPAQAVAEMLTILHPDISITFIARKQAFTTEHFEAVEAKVMSKYAKIIQINPPRQLYPWYWFQFLLCISKIFFSFLIHRPNVVVSFGSYVSIPGVMVAWLLRIPLVIHEQTRSISRSNALGSSFAKVICVNDDAVDVSKIRAPVKITGFPLRPSLFEKSLGSPYPIPAGIPMLLVTGGTTGAVSINELLFPNIDKLVKKYIVIHQTGNISFTKAQELKQTLPEQLIDRYIISSFSNTNTMNWIYRNASLVISRSGANTIYELLAFQLPAILIPLPWSQDNEQKHLADWFIQKQKGVVLEQNNLHAVDLYNNIEHIMLEIPKRNEVNESVHLKGTIEITKVIMSFV